MLLDDARAESVGLDCAVVDVAGERRVVVVRATEDGFALVECFEKERNTCVVASACGLRGPLAEALSAFLAVLDRYSLADLIRNPASLRRIRRLIAIEEGMRA